MQPEIETVTMKLFKCPRCGYKWIPRFANPKVCPRCKLYFKQEQQEETRPKDQEAS